VLLKDFEAAVDAFGANLAAWPDDLRAEGMALLRLSPEAYAILDAEAQVRAGLLNLRPIRAPAGLADRIVSKALAVSPVPQEVLARSKVKQSFRDHALNSRIGRALGVLGAPSAVLLPLCFVMGIVVSQMQTGVDSDSVALYVSEPYADFIR
jgi:hypothetical protein